MPTSNEDAVNLMAWLYLQEKLPNLLSPEPTEITVSQIPDNRINAILQKLSVDFTNYVDDKENQLENPTKESDKDLQDDLNNILSDVQEIISLLWKSATTPIEKETIKKFADGLIQKYQKNVR
jgi:hypothetical protein